MGVRSEVVDRKYLFEYEVGTWSLGTTQVLQARDADSLKTCKTVKKALLKNPAEAVARLRRLQGLQHTHISSVVDVLEDKNTIFIISDKTAGNDIAEWLERTLEEGNWIQEQTCAAYVREALVAMVHSHSSRVYHGGMHLGAMLMTTKLPDAFIKVADFGLAQALDPGSAALRKHETAAAFAAPELLQGGKICGATDVYSIGAIAHTLLVGQPPQQPAPNGWGLSSWNRDDKAIWNERSAASHDFVQRLINPDPAERPTAAAALRHPWLRGVAAKGAHANAAPAGAEEGLSHRNLGYMLAVLLIPEVMEYKDLQQLRGGFTELDEDRDGLVPCQRVLELLQERPVSQEAALAAVELADVCRCSVLDLCSTAVADLFLREGGDSVRRTADLTPRLLKRFFMVYGDARNFVVSIPQLRSRLCTSAGREMEVRCGVNYDEVLSAFPENALINSQMLVEELSQCEFRGTPLGDGEDYAAAQEDGDSSWGAMFGLDNLDDLFGQIFQSCGRCGSQTGAVVGRDRNTSVRGNVVSSVKV